MFQGCSSGVPGCSGGVPGCSGCVPGFTDTHYCLYILQTFLNIDKRLRANVTNGQTFGGNRSKINSAHILTLGRP